MTPWGSLFFFLLSTAHGLSFVTQISSDPYFSPKFQVEPSVFVAGKTIVSAFMTGRREGVMGAANIGWSVSYDSGVTWTQGFLRGVTKLGGGGSFDSVGDPCVTYDHRNKSWILSMIGVKKSVAPGNLFVLSSRSQDAKTWEPPVIVALDSQRYLDKEWVTCDIMRVLPFSIDGKCPGYGRSTPSPT